MTTDTAAAQRALELDADILIKATRVDGVFSDDPEKNPHAVLYSQLSYEDVLRQNLRVMDVEGHRQVPAVRDADHGLQLPQGRQHREGREGRARRDFDQQGTSFIA